MQAYQLYQYTQQKHSFVAGAMPEDLLRLTPQNVVYLLEKRFGKAVYLALNFEETIVSPIQQYPDSQWIKKSNMVGINVRTIGSFWNIVKYAFSLPAAQSAIHILPFWECGVVASLYGMASWNINTEFFSQELAQSFPQLNTVEKQLKVVVNLLHLMGKTVGMDVIPHTDRYSEIVLCNPSLFEWLQRKDKKITNHSADLYKEVEAKIIKFVQLNGSATYNVAFIGDLSTTFFSTRLPENERARILFGEKKDLFGRNQRRNQLIQYLYEAGYETVPATMGPPYRGLIVDENEEAMTIDADERVWRDYKISKSEAFSRVFGPLARYKLYDSKNNNQDWEIDFEQPCKNVFHYVAAKYAEVARIYYLDFMRGDMSHVQMRADGVPAQTDIFYDIHKFIKQHIGREKPYFAYFAESFLAPDGVMAYGSELDHLEQSDADTTLGDLQSSVVGSEAFLQNFRHYYEVAKTRTFTPSFTMMTGDKDDPRFDGFYVKGNELRLFVGSFFAEMPSYMGLGFECRDTHLSPAPNEHYTKLYVFQMSHGEKATTSPYRWGNNKTLFDRLTQIRLWSEIIFPLLQNKKLIWLQSFENQTLMAWTYEHLPYIFVANLDLHQSVKNIFDKKILFSTEENNEKGFIKGGECLILED
jgi:hypothetical protein